MELLGLLEDAGAVPQGEGEGGGTGDAEAQPAVHVGKEHEDEGQRVRAVAERGDLRVGGAGGSSDVKAGLQGGSGLERSHVGGDEQTDGENDDADDQAAEAVLVHNGGDENEHVGSRGEVAEGDDLVAERLQGNGEQQHDGDQDQGQGQGHGVADADGGVETDVDLAAVLEALLDELGSSVGDGQQALHEQGGHTGDQDEDGTEGDAQDQDLGDGAGDVGGVEVGDAADDHTDDGTDEQGLAEDAELLLHGLDVEVDVADAGDLVDEPVNGHGDRGEGGGETVRQGDAGHAQGLLDLRGGDVAEDQDDDLVDDGGGEADHDVVGDDRDDGAGEGEVPVVPDVDVDGLGGVGEQHQQVHDQAERDDEQADRGAHGDGRRGGPAHVDDGEGQAEALDHGLDRRGEVDAQEVVDDEVQADEADADRQTGLEALREAGAEDGADDRDDDGHHDGDAKALDEGKET